MIRPLALLALLAAPLVAQPAAPPPLVPLPAQVSPLDGRWVPDTVVVVTLAAPADTALRRLGALAAEIVRTSLGRPARLDTTAGARGGVHLALAAGGDAAAPADPRDAEAYALRVTADGAAIEAAHAAGLFYGLQTLRQLLDAAAATRTAPLAVAAVVVADRPRFAWRGLHLDVARHFMPVEFVKRYVDLMARVKLNTFHWHLTDDQGWRVEIRALPRLADVGGCRRETVVAQRFDPYVGDGAPHCGHYTQAEIREVVAYAAERHVTVVPEIELPGHAMAAIAAYPELACTPGPHAVRTTWGVEEEILCPGDTTFAVLETVFREVAALFPSRFVHVGGDEVPKGRWREGALARDVMRREGLADEAALQSWFIRRAERMLAAHGRRLVGWDEILEGGLAPGATVMSWRGTAGGIAAARAGHDVVMSPGSPLYLDHYQGPPEHEPPAFGGHNPLARVYAFEPVPDELTPAQARHVLGAQGNVWSEYLPSPAAVEYMVWPRALALAEVVWSPRERRDWDGFVARLPHALRALDRLGVGYRVPDVVGFDGDRLATGDSAVLRLHAPLALGEVRHTLDGTTPTRASPRVPADGRLAVAVPPGGVTLAVRAFTAAGRAGAPRAGVLRRAVHRAADPVDAAALRPGLRYAYAEAEGARSARAIDTLRVAREGVAPAVARRGDERAEHYLLRFAGYLVVPRDGVYAFALTSDDGSVLAIGDTVVVDHDGLHGAEERVGLAALRAGAHPLTAWYLEAGGGSALSLRVRVDDGPWTDVPAGWLRHRP